MLGFPQTPFSTPDFSGTIYWSKNCTREFDQLVWHTDFKVILCVYVFVYIKSKTQTHLVYSQTVSCASLGRDAHVPQVKKSVSGNNSRSQWWYFFIWEHSKVLLQRVMNLLKSVTLERTSRDHSLPLLCWARCANRIQLSVTAQCWSEKRMIESLV